MNDDLIDKLWENSNHGTRREDVVAAYRAGMNESLDEIKRLRAEVACARAIVELEGNRNDELNRVREDSKRYKWLVMRGWIPDAVRPDGFSDIDDRYIEAVSANIDALRNKYAETK